MAENVLSFIKAKGSRSKTSGKVKQLDPGRLQTLENYRRHRREYLQQVLEDFWPKSMDHVPGANGHYIDELDKAVLFIKKRKNQFVARQPKRTRGRQIKWDEKELRVLAAMHNELHKQGLKYEQILEEFVTRYGISYKKIEAQLTKARRLAKP
jgi:hypothetical protein